MNDLSPRGSLTMAAPVSQQERYHITVLRDLVQSADLARRQRRHLERYVAPVEDPVRQAALAAQVAEARAREERALLDLRDCAHRLATMVLPAREK